VIVVVGRVATDTERREELIDAGQALARASRQEAGCLGYRLYEDTETENALVFIEEWVSREALTEHFATDHVAEFMRVTPALLTGVPDVKFHQVAGTMDLQQAMAEARG
jgi:quinol monooxygenase YgiN